MSDRRYFDHGLGKLRRGIPTYLAKWPFDLSDMRVDVTFDDDFRVWRAARLPTELLGQQSRFVEHVRGYRVMATDKLLELGDDWTQRLRSAATG